MSSSFEHLRAFQYKINQGESFSLIRPSDGELLILQKQPYITQDNWSTTASLTVSEDLLEGLKKAARLPNMYVGLPCKDCLSCGVLKYYIDTFGFKNITYANIFINAQWKQFLKNLPPFYYIGPGKLDNLKVIERFLVDEYIINTWDETKKRTTDALEQWISSRRGLFLFSVGPISKIWIPHLHEKFPGNQFIDVGSALDIHLKANPIFRSYQKDGYKPVICSFTHGHVIPWYYFYTPDYDYWHRHLKNTLSDFFHVKPLLLDKIDGLHEQHAVHHWVGCSRKIQLVVDCIRENIGRRIVFSDVTIYVNPYKVEELHALVSNALSGMTFMRNSGLDEINIGFMTIDCTHDSLMLWENILVSIGPNDHDQGVVSKMIQHPQFFDASKCIARWPIDTASWNSHDRDSFIVLKIFTPSNEPKISRDNFRLLTMNDYGYYIDKEITCILTYYKRPYCFYEQLEAVRKQTIPPKKIIIWVNGVDFNIPDLQDVTVIHSSENFGVWGRFTPALLADTPYVCVFDDDTIPGSKWFENCYITMKKVNGLLGTVGVVFNNTVDTYSMNTRHGWADPRDTIKRVDIVGHSWFFKREWIQDIWSYYDPKSMFVTGEDIALSCALQKKGIYTYVPPHPPNDLEMFGSYPDKAYQYGCDYVAISNENIACERFNKTFETFRKKYDFELIRDTVFEGGWSYKQKEINELLKHTFEPGMKILELGAGDSTAKLYKILQPSLYYVYENDPNYVPVNDSIKTFMYTDVESVHLNHDGLLFDLVLIDGPHGESRKYWYSKLRSCVHPGTIILVDDFNHCKEFGESLDSNFEYELLSFSDETPAPYAEHSWKIVRVTKILRQETCIILNGILYDYTIDRLIEDYKNISMTKIISTWDYIDASKLRDHGFHIIQSTFPAESIAKKSVNYAMFSYLKGVEYAQTLGYNKFIRLRLDMYCTDLPKLLNLYVSNYQGKPMFITYMTHHTWPGDPGYLLDYGYMFDYKPNFEYQTENDTRFPEKYIQETVFGSSEWKVLQNKVTVMFKDICKNKIEFGWLKREYINDTNLLASYIQQYGCVGTPLENYNLNFYETTDLCQIMTHFGSDKGIKWTKHNFTVLYSKLFNHLRNMNNVNIFELGIGNNKPHWPYTMGESYTPGASLRGWKKWFLNASVYGADNDESILFQEDGIKTYHVDVYSPQSIQMMWTSIGDVMFDVIIDDAVHEFRANDTFIRNSYHKLNPYGIFVIEDVTENYLEQWKQAIPEYLQWFREVNYFKCPLEGNPYNNNLIILFK